MYKKSLFSLFVTAILISYGAPSFDQQTIKKYAVTKIIMQKTLNYTLLCAAEQNDLTTITRTLQKDAQINTSDEYGRTPLMLATINNNVAIAAHLLEAQANIDQQDNAGNTALQLALLNNNTDIATLLIGYNPNLNITNKNGQTALDIIQKKRLQQKLFGPKNQ